MRENQDAENKIAQASRKVLLLLLAVFPFGLIPFGILPAVTDSVWDTWHIPAFLIAGTVLLGVFGIRAAVCEQMGRGRTVVFCGLLYLTACSLRLFVIGLLQANPISDFYTCYELAATGNGDVGFLAKFPYLGAYALTLRLLFKISGASVWNAQIWNACVTSCIPVILYAAVYRITGKAKAGAAAGFLYAVCFPMIIYTAVPSCEHFSQFFAALAACAYAFYCMHQKDDWKKWVLSMITGMSIGCMCLYKNLFIMIAPSAFIAGFLYEVVPVFLNFAGKGKTEKKHAAGKAAIVIMRNIMLVFVVFFILKGGIFAVRWRLTGNTQAKSTGYAATIYKGLCMEGNGVWDAQVQAYIEQVLETYDDPKQADRIFYNRLGKEYKENPHALFGILRHKFFVDWCREDYYNWTFSGEENLIQGSWIGEVLFVFVPRIFFFFMSLGILIGLLAEILKNAPLQRMQFVLFLGGFVWLFSLALVLIEAQVRYKSTIMPLLCIFFGFCTEEMCDRMYNVSHKLQDHFAKEKRNKNHDQFQ